VQKITVLFLMGVTVGMAFAQSNVLEHQTISEPTDNTIQQRPLKQPAFTGNRISLNFQKISIRAVLQLLADFTNSNIVVSEKVQGTITLRLNEVPWDQALDIILTTHGLDKKKTNNIILIDTKAAIEEINKNQLKSIQNKEQLEPLHSGLLQIKYAKAIDIATQVNNPQNSLLSFRGKLSMDPRTNTLWIQDTDKKIKEVKKLIKQLDIPVKQVLIEARIVEVTKDFSQEMGIRWGISKSSYQNSSERENNSSGELLNPKDATSLSRKLNLDLVPAATGGISPASMSIALAKLADNILLDLELSALESEGRAELISSPRLITTNQQSAIIQSGQEIPYQELNANGTASVAFKKAVLSLKVTPQITSDNKILMEIHVNQDTPSAEKFQGVPAILTKQIQTNVLVNNGQTIVLGGIYKQDKNRAVNRVPFLGELPVVGPLFRDKQIIEKKDELLIFITPRIIGSGRSPH
jgi:type IV pilus assembly protein PilQ